MRQGIPPSYVDYPRYFAIEFEKNILMGQRSRLAAPLPDKPGTYFWDTWGTYVEVYKKPGGRHLYVKPPVPNAVEVRISDRIAGNFIAKKD